MATIFVLSSCNKLDKVVKGNGNVDTKVVSVNGFKHISIGGNYHLILKKGFQEKVEITCDENLMSYIQVHSDADKLKIENEGNLVSENNIEVVVYFQHITGVDSYGASFVDSDDQITEDDFRIDLAGVGAISLDLDVSYLTVSMSGAGAVELSGSAHEADLRISGAGGLDAYDLETAQCNVEISGIGGAEVYVTDFLEAHLRGIGGISYKGQPNRIERHITGLGEVKPADEVAQ